MDQKHKPGPINRRRRRLIAATSAVGAIEIAAAAVPFVGSLLPSARAKAAGAPVRVNVSGVEPGQIMTVSWREKPVWILHRTPAELRKVEHSKLDLSDPGSRVPQQPPDMDLNLDHGVRAVRPQYLVLVGICTHLGCIPEYRPQPGSVGPEWTGGFYCPCHGSKYDLSGRVLAGSPAPINLPVPPYYFESPGVIKIGELKDGADLNWEPKGW